MKKTFYGMFLAVIIITACQPKTKTLPVDSTTAKDAVAKILEKYHSAVNAREVNTLTDLLATDGLYCGTDSKEFWDKPTYSNEMTKIFADTSNTMKYSIDKREIRIAIDGNSAISIEQCLVKNFSTKIPIRMVSHLVKTGNDWKIDFSSASLIPNNEDLAKLNKALE
jgi:ketosteroid isomerase-like protein